MSVAERVKLILALHKAGKISKRTGKVFLEYPELLVAFLKENG